MRIEIWSDIVCPWCAIGKARLDLALAQFEHADDVDIRWRSFELDPGAPTVRDGDYATMLARKYGTTVEGGHAMIRRMADEAAQSGLRLNLERARPGNTFDGHRLLHLAADRGVQNAVKDRLLRGYLAEGEAIGEHDTLLRLATEAGLDPDDARTVLDTSAYAYAVRTDEREAASHGISGVPYFLIDGWYPLPGAQTSDVMLDALRQAWRKSHPDTDTATSGTASALDGHHD
ncbi:DsbA family oxidoreductase [Haloechinothrix salitolerans]|uniref:DsbA family oxidoreductase n=1 Tax=Haloechinothrix salitolerans TaxID=926830 RepID=A0ABW2C4I8_9PSEU